MEKITIEISSLAASCLQRMIAIEIENQERWKSKDGRIEARDEVIKEMNDLIKQLEKKGFKKYYI